ncbi:MAG: UDP-N-acetylmuramate dehydrogenase [Cyanobacteria bacterium P01_F01_bin.3]
MTASTPTKIVLPETNVVIESQATLASMTSFRVGGPAEWLAIPKTIEQLQESYLWGLEQGYPITFLGAGSNLLISDLGLPGLIISTRQLKNHTIDADTGIIKADAGQLIPRLATQAAKKGCAGFEWAVGIPGSVGGAVVMNAGAHGGCVADSLIEAQVLQKDGAIAILSNQQMQYGYRASVLQSQPQIVIHATFQLTPGQDPEAVLSQTHQHRDHRLSTQPYNWPSCGSVFRNPLPKTAGWLIEQSGLKGYMLGGAQVAQKHANFILNQGQASASDIFNLIHHVQETVDQKWGYRLHPEVKMLGEFPAR